MSGTELGDVAYIMPPCGAKLANRGRATDLPWRLTPSIASNSLLGSQLIEMQLLLEEKSVGLVGQQLIYACKVSLDGSFTVSPLTPHCP
jgi:hypothetical protein